MTSSSALTVWSVRVGSTIVFSIVFITSFHSSFNTRFRTVFSQILAKSDKLETHTHHTQVFSFLIRERERLLDE